MVAAAMSSRARPAASSGQGVSVKKPRRAIGTWVMIGVPVLLALTFVWTVGSSLMHTEITVREAVTVSSVSLESDPRGARIDLVLADRIGQETTVNGDLTVKLREPDGTIWQTVRTVTAADFAPLQGSGLLNGRLGYAVVIPADDWVRAPRRGGAATVSVQVQRADGSGGFSTVAEERFP